MTTATLFKQGPDNTPGEQLGQAEWPGGDEPIHFDGRALRDMRPMGIDATEDPEAWFDALEAWGGNGYVMVEVVRD